MTRLVLLRGSIFKKILIVCCVLVCICIHPTMALAQHGGGGHAGGGGMHGFAAPPASHAPVSHAPISQPRVYAAPPVGAFGRGAFRYRWRPIYPWRPVYPVYGFYGYPYFGWPYWGFGWGYGAGFGWNSCWWASCDLFWAWGLGYNTLPFYAYGNGYGSGYYPPPPSYEYPAYGYGGERRDLPQLYLKDGTVYNVTDYWLVDEQIHFTMIENGKVVEHVIGLDELDLQRTIDVNTARGFRFVLRNAPVEQYLKDHPDLSPDDE